MKQKSKLYGALFKILLLKKIILIRRKYDARRQNKAGNAVTKRLKKKPNINLRKNYSFFKTISDQEN